MDSPKRLTPKIRTLPPSNTSGEVDAVILHGMLSKAGSMLGLTRALKAREHYRHITRYNLKSWKHRYAPQVLAKHTAKEFTTDVKKIVKAPIKLENDHLSGKGTFSAGEVAKIETRGLKKGDCVCSNEAIFYQPLTKVSDISPAYSNTLSYTGKDFDRTWTTHGQRNAFLATFRR